MDIQIVGLTNLSWVQVPDRQAFAMRMVSLPSRRSMTRLDRPATQALERLPALDWPATLFVDEKLSDD